MFVEEELKPKVLYRVLKLKKCSWGKGSKFLEMSINKISQP